MWPQAAASSLPTAGARASPPAPEARLAISPFLEYLNNIVPSFQEEIIKYLYDKEEKINEYHHQLKFPLFFFSEGATEAQRASLVNSIKGLKKN